MHHTEYTTRLAAYAAIVEDGKILLTWYNGYGGNEPCWTLPGGGIEYEETPVQAVEREAVEETGHTVEVGEPLVVSSFTLPADKRTGRPYKALRVVYRARVTGGTLGTTEVGGSTDFARWVDLDEARTLEPVASIVTETLAALG